MQTGNKDKFLSLDFGLREFGVKNEKERLRRYRRYVYEAGAVHRPEKGNVKVIDKTVVEKERKKDFELSFSVSTDTLNLPELENGVREYAQGIDIMIGGRELILKEWG